jgi:hypothetical protein
MFWSPYDVRRLAQDKWASKHLATTRATHVRSIVGSNNGPNNVFFFLVCIKFLGNNGARIRPATGRRGWKLMVSLESFKRIFHHWFVIDLKLVYRCGFHISVRATSSVWIELKHGIAYLSIVTCPLIIIIKWPGEATELVGLALRSDLRMICMSSLLVYNLATPGNQFRLPISTCFCLPRYEASDTSYLWS